MKTYLGDSVYADTDEYHIILTTEQGDGVASNIIYLDTTVVTSLIAYINNVKNESKEADEQNP
jgi:hypothetical protein